MTKAHDWNGGWCGVALGLGAFAGTGTGRAIGGVAPVSGEKIATVALVALAASGFVRVIRTGPGNRRAWILLLLSITSVYVVFGMLDAHEDRWRPDLGGARPLVSVEGTFLDVARSDPARPGRRDPKQEVPHVVTMRVESFPMAVDPLVSLSRGDEIPVRIASGSAPDLAGVKVSVVGRLMLGGRPSNPNSGRGLRTSEYTSILVPDSRLITPVTDMEGRIEIDWTIATGSQIRARFHRGIDAMASYGGVGFDEESILWCLLTGDRSRLDERARIAFKRSGVSHLLAISGLHLAVVASIPWFILGWLGVGRVIRCAVTAIVVIGGVTLVESSPSVIRAASMIVPVLAGAAIGATFRVIPMLGIAAGGMLWIDPGWIDSCGFQMSFVATSALAFSCHAARKSWFGPRDSIGRSRAMMLHDRWSKLSTASIVACFATLPLVESRFGVVPLALIPASIMIAPLMFAFLVLIVPVSIVSLVDPSFGYIFSAPIVGFDILIRWFVEGIAEVSPVMLTLDPGVSWTILATILGITFPGLPSNRFARGIAASVFFALISIPMLPSGPNPKEGRLRVDMLAVGDGTAILMRTCGSTVLFDAGSSSIPGYGADTILRGLRSLGVRRIDGIVISHANLDHHGAIESVVRTIPTNAIVVTPAFLRRIHRTLETAEYSSLRRAFEHVSSLLIVDRSDRIPFPDGSWLVVHPQAGDGFRRTNDESIALRIHAVAPESEEEDQVADLFLLGDLETAGVVRLMDRATNIRSRVMELPHHGSWRAVVVDLIEAVAPGVILQSTGPRRFEADRFGPASRRRIRLVTCRDGATAVTISGDGSMEVTTTKSGIRAGVRLP